MSKSILLSLEGPVRMLTDTYREIALAALNRYKGNGPVPFPSVVIDYAPFMEALLNEMFEMLNDPASKKVGTVAGSTRLLMNAGLTYQQASELSADIFSYVADIIGANIPGATFSNAAGYMYGFCHPCDLMIHPPIPREEPEAEEVE
jgi:hypothetical protein